MTFILLVAAYFNGKQMYTWLISYFTEELIKNKQISKVTNNLISIGTNFFIMHYSIFEW